MDNEKCLFIVIFNKEMQRWMFWGRELAPSDEYTAKKQVERLNKIGILTKLIDF